MGVLDATRLFRELESLVTSEFEHLSAVVFVGTPADPANVFLREEARPAESSRADEDLRCLFRHEHCGFHSLRRTPEGDDAVIFEQDYARRETQLFDVMRRLPANDL